MYWTFKEKGRQYIALISLECGKRIVIPLSGNLKIRGMIHLVLKEKRVVIHYAAPLRVSKQLEGEAVRIEAGLSDVFTDDHGKK
ncbi:hypothetical protein MFUM_180016 [Methylacidiphilum fumariolicum SolV]|uniref:Uncharacterized protein n=1 Tax=Methylacidiphilum fumariolicum (strain SolV) TaxID=1156937 RepID=I0JWM6_METFB|nr:hypothetical protein [Candidatus Methylacidiphilum fumarolicum]CCG91645.1 hypothetical protein MFUM_180016 [Methylacidiphilum fumariolicum SolV]